MQRHSAPVPAEQTPFYGGIIASRQSELFAPAPTPRQVGKGAVSLGRQNRRRSGVVVNVQSIAGPPGAIMVPPPGGRLPEVVVVEERRLSTYERLQKGARDRSKI